MEGRAKVLAKVPGVRPVILAYEEKLKAAEERLKEANVRHAKMAYDWLRENRSMEFDPISAPPCEADGGEFYEGDVRLTPKYVECLVRANDFTYALARHPQRILEFGSGMQFSALALLSKRDVPIKAYYAMDTESVRRKASNFFFNGRIYDRFPNVTFDSYDLESTWDVRLDSFLSEASIYNLGVNDLYRLMKILQRSGCKEAYVTTYDSPRRKSSIDDLIAVFMQHFSDCRDVNRNSHWRCLYNQYKWQCLYFSV